MILLWGLPDDTPLAYVADALRERRAGFFFLNHADVLETEVEVSYGPRPRGVLRVRGERLLLEEVGALYSRPYDSGQFPHLAELDAGGPEHRHARACEDILWGFAEVTPARVVNRPSAMQSNGSKPFQARAIERAGFRVPATLVTSSERELLRFWRRHRQVVYKSASGLRSIVSTLGDEHRRRLGQLRWCPTQFQEYVPGDEFRVHVVGEETFATRIGSDAVDYRYAGAEYEPAILPAGVARRCVELARRLGLALAGIDLRRRPDGRWYCFEVNPSPAYSCYETATGQRISAAIAELLVAADARGR